MKVSTLVTRLGMVTLGTFAGITVADDSKPPSLSDELVERGQEIYQESCASCHGANGEGAANWQERNSLGELPAPPHDEDGHTWKHSDALLYRMVRDGWRHPFNETDRLTMPSFEAVLSPQEIRAVIMYLKTLWTPEQRQFQWEETQEQGGFPASAYPEDSAESTRSKGQ
ncbi:c-type cytochrome [Aquisalimonas lutea]|uniref:c-type cytochrome n=1 Tax=Aquisalimonas lutea TaxID=1327750 RepID=UPI0025B30083|nr:c-type cytochrome [Aquisalimonas lutea]MDN3519066.1 c-type cytochrome [Aquisalimonas lutea]